MAKKAKTTKAADDAPEPRTIVSFELENFMRVRLVTLTMKGPGVIELTGRNRQGKTSILDGLWTLIEGMGVAPEDPIRHGTDEARMFADLGDIQVTRRIWRKESGELAQKLIVEGKDGMRAQKPQEFLTNLLGKMSFDPLEFERAKPKEQFDMLKGFVPGFDFEEDTRLRKQDFDNRAHINRRVAEMEAEANAILVDDEGLKPVDEQAILDKISKVAETNAEIQRRQAERDQLAVKAKNCHAAAERWTNEAKRLREEADRADAECDKALGLAREAEDELDDAPPLPAPANVSELRAQLDNAREANVEHAKLMRKRALVADAAAMQQKADALTAAIKARDEARREAIASAKMPIDGISFGDDAVLLRDVPFAQASDAERLEASLAIAMAMNPAMRVIRCHEGSRLDNDAMALLEAKAEAEGYQVFVESVNSSRPSALHIEDGMVVEH